jgi:altronate dehydratase large subunit
MQFQGYVREDGQVGVRNHVLVMSAVSCINTVTQQIARMTKTIPITHGYGCLQAEKDIAETEWALAQYAQNPNVAAVFMVGLGCEQIDAEQLASKVVGKPTGFVKVARVGTSNAIAQGIKRVRELKLYASHLNRQKADLGNLIIRVQCGGSDASSGLAANPALGVASELLVREGGKVLLESITFAESVLLKHITEKQVIEGLWKATDVDVQRYRQYPTVRGINPTPGNIEQGLTTLMEKRLGSWKGGNAPFKGVITYKERPRERGLYWASGGNYIGTTDIVGATMSLLQGVQINCFTTGYGNPVGLAIAPVIKITGNPTTYERNQENMDINASPILCGEETVEAVGKQIFKQIIEVANGKCTKSEIMGHGDFFLPIFKSP